MSDPLDAVYHASRRTNRGIVGWHYRRRLEVLPPIDEPDEPEPPPLTGSDACLAYWGDWSRHDPDSIDELRQDAQADSALADRAVYAAGYQLAEMVECRHGWAPGDGVAKACDCPT